MDYKQKVASRKQKQKSTIYRYLMTRFMTHTPVELGKTGQGMGEDARRVSAVGRGCVITALCNLHLQPGLACVTNNPEKFGRLCLECRVFRVSKSAF